MHEDFPLGNKTLSKAMQSVFLVWPGANQQRLRGRLPARVNRIFPGCTREPDVGDFLSYRIVKKKVFVFPVFSLQLSLSRFIASQQCHELTWSYPKSKPHWQHTTLCCALVPFVRLACPGQLLPSTVLSKVRDSGVIFHLVTKLSAILPPLKK